MWHLAWNIHPGPSHEVPDLSGPLNLIKPTYKMQKTSRKMINRGTMYQKPVLKNFTHNFEPNYCGFTLSNSQWCFILIVWSLEPKYPPIWVNGCAISFSKIIRKIVPIIMSPKNGLQLYTGGSSQWNVTRSWKLHLGRGSVMWYIVLKRWLSQFKS